MWSSRRQRTMYCCSGLATTFTSMSFFEKLVQVLVCVVHRDGTSAIRPAGRLRGIDEGNGLVGGSLCPFSVRGLINDADKGGLLIGDRAHGLGGGVDGLRQSDWLIIA